jgi:hypothetical protein
VEFIREIDAISSSNLFDLMVLREIDIHQIDHWLGETTDRRLLPYPPTEKCFDALTSTKILAENENFSPILEWLTRQFDACNYRRRQWNRIIQVGALATFFPEITSRSDEFARGDELPGEYTTRSTAIHALANAVRLALALKQRSLTAPSCWGRHAIVEMVCGTILDQCPCAVCKRLRQSQREDYAVVSKRPHKIQLLVDALCQVYHLVRDSREGRDDDDWALAIELEPGPTYVVNDLDAANDVFASLPAELARHVGLNVDIAHMKIAEVPASRASSSIEPPPKWTLEDFRQRIVHAHLCDHPGMHTCDQVVGSWHPVEYYGCEDYPYIELLSAIANGPKRPAELPFSASVALELEGCNRIRSAHHSLIAMKHMCELVHARTLSNVAAEPASGQSPPSGADGRNDG